MEAADLGERHDAATIGKAASSRDGRVLVQGEVCSRLVVIGEVGSEDPAEMPFVQDDDMVQALSADRADQSFDVAVLPRRSRSNRNILDAMAARRWRKIQP